MHRSHRHALTEPVSSTEGGPADNIVNVTLTEDHQETQRQQEERYQRNFLILRVGLAGLPQITFS